MKSMLYVAVEEAPAVDSVEEEILKRHFANFDENFFHFCDKGITEFFFLKLYHFNFNFLFKSSKRSTHFTRKSWQKPPENLLLCTASLRHPSIMHKNPLKLSHTKYLSGEHYLTGKHK